MAQGRHDFDWLLDQARAIAFDPARLSLYVFAMDADAGELRQSVLEPMRQAGLFSLDEAKFIADDRRHQYRGQLARVALSIFDVNGSQYGIAMTYHDNYRPDPDQYEAWSRFWHERCLQAAKGS